MDSFRDLMAWQKAMVLATSVYRATGSFPREEMYGLTMQLRRAAVAVPSDIAEGKGRISKKEFVQMLAKARGSACEVETQLEISKNLGRLVNGLIKSVQRSLRADS